MDSRRNHNISVINKWEEINSVAQQIPPPAPGIQSFGAAAPPNPVVTSTSTPIMATAPIMSGVPMSQSEA